MAGPYYCSRRRELRWPTHPPVGTFVCHRCTETLAGGNTVDPLPSDAQKAAGQAAGARLRLALGGVAGARSSRVTMDPSPAGDLPKNWPILRARVLKRDGRECKHCGSRERLSVHHIVPRPDGSHSPRNLVTLCDTCHDALESPPERGAI